MLSALPPSIRRPMLLSMRAGSSIMHSFSSGTSTPLSEADTEVMVLEGPVEAAAADDYHQAPTGRDVAWASNLQQAAAPRTLSLAEVDWRYGRQGMVRQVFIFIFEMAINLMCFSLSQASSSS